MRGAFRSRAAPVALFLLLAVLLFSPAVFGGKVLSGSDLLLFRSPFSAPAGLERPSNAFLFDAAYVFEPDQLQVREAMRGGRLPVWTPDLSAGRPLLAAQQSAPFFPLNWIADLLPYHRALVWVAVLKLLLAALGTYLLCRALGLGRVPALLGGVSFGFGAYLVVWLAHPQSNAYLLLPWLFLLADRVCRRGRPADAALLAGAIGLAFLGGHPQSAFIELLAVAPYAAWRVRDRRRAGLLALAGLGGLGLAAIALVPFAEALSESYNVSRGVPALPGRSGLALFFPEMWGRPDKYLIATGPPNFPERSAYFGALPTLLAVAGLVARRPSGEQVYFAALVGVGGLVALNSGPFADLVRDLPLLTEINLNRTLVLVAFGGAVLAAFGLERLQGASREERLRMLAAAAAVALLPALGWVAGNPGTLSSLGDALGELPDLGEAPKAEDVPALASVLRWLVLGSATVALLAIALARPRLAPAVAGAAVALAALDLLLLARGYHPSVPEERADPPAPPVVRFLQREARGTRVASENETFGPNTPTRYGLAEAGGHELPVVERHQRLWAALGGGGYQRTTVDPANPSAVKLLDLFGVRYAISGGLAERGLRTAFAGPGGPVVENRSALPRAFVAYRWRSARTMADALGAVAASPSSQARSEPVVEKLAPPPAGPPRAPSPARVVRATDTEVKVSLTARAPGLLVLGDTYYPGWKADVDGRDAEIRPANGAFRAVRVPAGRHSVRFRYRPASVYAGAGISLAALLALAAALAWRRPGRK